MNFWGASEHLARLIKSSCEKNPWPVGKKDKKWLELANSSRTSLAKFWQAMRSYHIKTLQSAGVLQSFIDEDIKILSAHQDPEYIMELEKEFAQIDEREKARLAAFEASRRPLNTQDTTGDTISKEKPSAHLAGEQPQAELPEIAVKLENLALFHHMFPKTGEVSSKTIKWQHFLDAMTDAGFSIVQGSGSAVSFHEHNSIVDNGSIVFHKPHPVPEIHPVMLCIMGKRLSKWFGWRRETFVEKKKSQKEEERLEE